MDKTKAEKLLKKIDKEKQTQKENLQEPDTIRLNPKDINKLKEFSFPTSNTSKMPNKVLGLEIIEDIQIKEGGLIYDSKNMDKITIPLTIEIPEGEFRLNLLERRGDYIDFIVNFKFYKTFTLTDQIINDLQPEDIGNIIKNNCLLLLREAGEFKNE